MELKDTIGMMTSADYKERFKAEYYQLKIRRDKLDAMLNKWDEGELNFQPTCSRGLYSIQITAMNDYLCTLEERARWEGVEL